MDFDLSTPPPLWEMAYWIDTIERWREEGDIGFEGDDADENRRHGMVHVNGVPIIKDPAGGTVDLERPLEIFPGNYWIYPENEREVIEDRGDRQIVIDEIGVKMEVVAGSASIPRYIEWPVTNREDWEQYKAERFDLKTPGRYPERLDETIAAYNDRDYALRLGKWVGFFGPPRFFLGEVRIMTLYYDDPDLIRDIVNDLLDFYIAVYAPVLEKLDIDVFTMWEDMCYNTGPLISPEMFREFMLPAYKKFTSFLKDMGVKRILVDTDGNCWKLIPLFLEGGVTAIYPYEAAANMDVVEVREAFPNLQMIGGIDKRAVIAGKKAIDAELERKIPPMLQKGGFIPYIDHHVPPDISLENFIYYRKKLQGLIEGHFSR
jgi:uroporphyrinogen decarboxylase